MPQRIVCSVCLILLGLPGVAPGKGKRAVRLMRAFCRDLAHAGKVFADGSGAEQKLRACVFTKKHELRRCARMLGVDRRAMRYVRKNSRYFEISGDALSGFVLQVNRRRLEEIEQCAPGSPYTGLIGLRLRIQALAHELGTQKTSGDLPAHLREPERSSATPADLADAQQRYLALLGAQIERERDDDVSRCLLREQERFARLTATPGQRPAKKVNPQD